MKTKQITTAQLVRKMQSESKEVKQSTGGIKAFREIMSFIQVHDMRLNNECELIPTTSTQLADLIELNFSKKDINEAKALYII